MGETMRHQILEGLQKYSRERSLILLGDFKDILGGEQRLITLRMTDFCKHQTRGGGGIETKFDGHEEELRKGLTSDESRFHLRHDAHDLSASRAEISLGDTADILIRNGRHDRRQLLEMCVTESI